MQAGKLAALGQMSAASSHEINQPLAAARNYADSAAVLIDRGDAPRAQENVGQILSLIDRMADDRAAPAQRRAQAQRAAAAVDLRAGGGRCAGRLRRRGLTARRAAVRSALPDDLPLVQGGPVRLQQVIVNVLSNAADAVEGTDDRALTSARADGGRVTLDDPRPRPRRRRRRSPTASSIRSSPPRAWATGLGLGLSISYNIMKDFGGDLRVANHPDGRRGLHAGAAPPPSALQRWRRNEAGRPCC